jgi:signal transduction histidine kinase
MKRFSFHGRAERLVAAARMTLAAFSVLAARLDVLEPGRYGRPATSLLSGYLWYAVVLFALLGVVGRLPAWWPAVTHAVEFGVFMAFMFFTGGANSPFFVFFTFSLVCATLRWQWRGTLWTAVAAISVYLLMGLYASWVPREPRFDLNVFIVRSSYLLVVALLLGYLGMRQQKLDHAALQERREAAALEERTRLSRDLHDGLLQSLTGIALQLEVLYRVLDRDPQAAPERLREIQDSIAGEQRDLRSLIDRLNPVFPFKPVGSSLGMRLEEMCVRIERQWGLRVELATDGLTDRLPDEFAEEITRIVHEALVNAARHAEPSVLRVGVARNRREVLVRVEDDGHGFSFRGRYDLAALRRMKAGPITLEERIAALGGDLVISSAESGSCLDVVLPVPKMDARQADLRGWS